MQIPSVGKVVTVTTRWRDSYYWAESNIVDRVTTGTIVNNDPWTPVGCFQMTTGRPEYPTSVIAIRNVVSIKEVGKTEVKKLKNSNLKIFKVKSSKGDQVYNVTNDNGSWSCSCVGFQYHRRCKHISSLQKK